jgi:hypothetical protein
LILPLLLGGCVPSSPFTPAPTVDAQQQIVFHA